MVAYCCQHIVSTLLLVSIIDGNAYHPQSIDEINNIFTIAHNIFDGRIIGGAVTNINNFPFMVQIQVRFNQQSFELCGGSILSPTIILTAGHCVSNAESMNHKIIVRAGTSFKDSSAVYIPVTAVEIHPNYRDFAGLMTVFDIAILKLERPLKYSKKIQPAKIAAEHDRIRKNNMGTVVGWGITISGNFSSTSPVLRYATNFQILSLAECRDRYKNYESFFKKHSKLGDLFLRFVQPIGHTMFCAFSKSLEDTCQGDSGGPFLLGDKIYGIVSWGNGCADPFYPGVYTNISDPYIYNWCYKTFHKLNKKFS